MRFDRAFLAGRAAAPLALDPELDAALVSGGDARLALDATRMNAYGTQPFPRDEISLSSSTASTISPRGHAAAAAAFERLERARAHGRFASVFAEMADDVRTAIRNELELAGAEVVLSPSGTDSALQALFLARGLAARPVTSIVVAADESGNGVAAAAAGRHFAAVSSGGQAVGKGEPVTGLGCVCVTVAVRDAFGLARPLAEIDAEVLRAATSAARAGHAIVLYVMDHSKLGGAGPSLDCVRDVQAIAPDAVQVVIDACQVRLSRARLASYLEQGFLVLVTGSKFFAGPPLSGALLVPESLQRDVARIHRVPAGLVDYMARDDWSARFARIRGNLPIRANVGQLLRWIAAVEEIRGWFAVPTLFRKLALAEFAAAMPRHIARFSEVALMPEPLHAPGDAVDADQDEFAVRTIFPFTVTHEGRALSFEQTRWLHKALNSDAAVLGLPHADPIAATPCHIGQPVAIADGRGGTIGALRISADARLVSESWAGAGAGDLVSTRRLTERIGEVATVFEKLRLLMSHLPRLDCIPTA
jgi:hypothetical protein